MFQNVTGASALTHKTAVDGIVLPAVNEGAGWTNELRTNTQTQLTALSGSLNDFKTHTDGHLSNLHSRMSMYESDTNRNETLTPTPGGGSNVCSGISGLFGTLMAAGAALMSAINTVIQTVLGLVQGAIEALVAGITAVLATIASLVGQIAGMIAAEVAALAALVVKAVNWAVGQFLAFLKDTFCSNDVINAVKTPALDDFLG